jgi:hypothetical protein
MGWRQRNITARSGSPLATFEPAAYLFAQFTRHAIFQGFTTTGGSDGRLYELYCSEDDIWHFKDLMDEADAPLAAAYPTAYIFATEGTQHVLYQGVLFDGHVHELWWDDSWHHNDLTNETGAPETLTAPSGFEAHFEGTQNVVYQGHDRRIHLLSRGTGDGRRWSHTNLTATGGPPPPPGSVRRRCIAVAANDPSYFRLSKYFFF